MRLVADGREVDLTTESDAGVSMREMCTEALAAWRSLTSGPSVEGPGTEGPAFGLQAETSPDRPASSSAIGLMGVVE